MNNLHRELAPISAAAWSQIEAEASRTLKRYLAARRVVDVQGPSGTDTSAIGTGHLHTIAPPGEGILHASATSSLSSSFASLSASTASRSTTWSVAPMIQIGSP